MNFLKMFIDVTIANQGYKQEKSGNIKQEGLGLIDEGCDQDANLELQIINVVQT